MLTIVVGAQYGGEGKGKVSAYLAKRQPLGAVARCGGVNSSHTVVEGSQTYRLRLLPTAAVVGKPPFILYGAGTLLHLPTLFEEIKQVGVDPGTIMIDPQAGIITEECVQAQRQDERYAEIGSTLTGTGYASARRCLRALPVARDFPELKSMLGHVSDTLLTVLSRRRDVLVEGHQGYGLSNYHGDYPYTSSRDCTAAGLLSELGIGPAASEMRIVLVVKCFPTRNHGGHLKNEMPVEYANKLNIREFGGGSWGIADNRRRVGVIDFDLIGRAARANSATEIAITGADYLDRSVRGACEPAALTKEIYDFIDTVEKVANARVTMVSTGPETDAMIYLRSSGGKKRVSRDQEQLRFLQ